MLQLFSCTTNKRIEQLNSAALLQNYFQDSLTIKTDDKMIIEYCPDNTCDVMAMDGRNNENILADFAYLYLFFGSNYSYLLEWKNNEDTKQHLFSILRKYTSVEWAKLDDNKKAQRVLNQLSSQYGITVSFVRYDEGAKYAVPINLEDIKF